MVLPRNQNRPMTQSRSMAASVSNAPIDQHVEQQEADDERDDDVPGGLEHPDDAREEGDDDALAPAAPATSGPGPRLAGSSATFTGVATPNTLSSGSMSKGAFQPPRNRTVVIAERMNTFTYSAKKKKPKRMPLYSVAKPATISAVRLSQVERGTAALGGRGDEEDERAERLTERGTSPGSCPPGHARSG